MSAQHANIEALLDHPANKRWKKKEVIGKDCFLLFCGEIQLQLVHALFWGSSGWYV